MDDVHINVVELEVAQGFPEGFLNSIGVMVGLPKLGDDEEIFSLDSSGIKNALNSFSNFLLVSVIGSSIKASVTSLNGIDNSLGTDIVGEFPETESTLRHLSSGSESEASLSSGEVSVTVARLFDHLLLLFKNFYDLLKS